MAILAAGAGASEGLDTMLTRMMLEQQLAQRSRQLDEETRHNQADESLRGRQIDATALDRADRIAEARRALTDKTVSARGIGDTVTEGEYKDETGAGFPTGDYKITPGAKVTKLAGFSSAPGTVSSMTGQGSAPDAPAGKVDIRQDESSPLNNPRLISFKGTEAQRLARDKEMQGQPVNNELKPHITHDPGTAAALGVKVDQPFNVWANPRTRALAMENGMPIPPQHAANLQPYERPPSPDRVLIQTGDGYERRTDAARTLAGGGSVPLATPAQVRNRQDMASKVGGHFDDLESELEEANQKGLLGPVLGRYSDFMAGKVGSTGNPENDDLLGRLRLDLAAATTGFASIHGRNGANLGIARDIQDKLNTGKMSYEGLKGGISAMRKWVQGYAVPTGTGAAPAPTPAPAGDVYEQYMNRPKQ